MPWTEKRASGAHRACWRDASGEKRTKASFATESEALRYAGEQESKARRGEVEAAHGHSMTWGAWCDIWWPLRRVEASTRAVDLTSLRRHVRPRWDGVRLAAISNLDVQAWVAELETAGLQPGTVIKIYHLFSASMNAAVRAGRLPASPCIGIGLPAPVSNIERYLTRAEFDRILTHLNEPYRTAAILLVGTGLRIGELSGLHWSRVDLDGELIHVVDTYDSIQRSIKPYGKTANSTGRSVPIPSWVRTALLQARLRNASLRSCGVPHASGARCHSGLVVPGPNGAPLDHRNFRPRHWQPAVEAAGLDGVRLHDLRHTYASWLVQAGRSLQEVGKLLGHSRTSTTERYAHLSRERYQLAQTALEGFGPGAASDDKGGHAGRAGGQSGPRDSGEKRQA